MGRHAKRADPAPEPAAEPSVDGDLRAAEPATDATTGGAAEVPDPPTSEATGSGPPDHRWRWIGRSVGAVVFGLGIALGLYASGWIADTSNGLEAIGFDPDRADLLASLTAGAISGALAVLVFGARRTGVLVAAVSVAVLFGPTVVVETQSALNLQGLEGSFDPVGWGLTVLGLVVAAVAIGWVVATLASAVRAHIRSTGRAVERAARQRTIRRVGLSRLVADAFVIVLLVVSLPIIGDMLDYGPQTHMAQGAGQPVPPLDSNPPIDDTPSAPGPVETSSPPPITVSGDPGSSARPWAESRPKGEGRLELLQLPAPWTGGVRSTIDVNVYLPPGYDGTARRYPVLYEVPWSARPWETGMRYTEFMDAAIQSGTLPPEITVFVAQNGGPYPASECADSFDGREHFDTFVATTMVAYVDSHFRTMPTAAARSLFGFSQGGFCAANLLVRHPDVFGQAVSISGYFVAGLTSLQTPIAWRPWGRQPALMAANSPLTAVTGIVSSERSRMFVVLAASATEAPYGQQLTAFAAALSGAGVAHAILADSLGHSWQEVRADLPAALGALADHQALLGVFGSGS